MERNTTSSQESGFASIMVPLNLGVGAADRVKLSLSLAERFGSRLIGIAAQDIVVPYMGDGTASIDELLIEQARQAATDDVAKAEETFRRTASHYNGIAWRCGIEASLPFVLRNARAADIVVVGRQASLDAPQGRMALSPADLVMELGRPLLIVPPDVTSLSAENIVIAWRDTREARRAVWDALPFLKRAETVTIVSLGADAREQGADDVRGYLALHGVSADVDVRSNITGFAAEELIACARRKNADLIVAGAYGHSRMREWLLGGMTADLLDTTPVCCMMSH